MVCITRILSRAGLAFAIAAVSQLASAQFSLGTAIMYPPVPTSADPVYLKISRTCGETRYGTPPYSVSLNATRIDVHLRWTGSTPPACQPDNAVAPPTVVELGKLPAGSYSVVVSNASFTGTEVVITPALRSAVTVNIIDRRDQLSVSRSRIDYTDHWWDPADSGAGFMIWHSNLDQLLAVWFTYGPDGKATWYTVQSGTWVTPTRYDGLLIAVSRPPVVAINGFPEVANTEGAVIGSATLDFGTGDGTTTGRLSYNITATGLAVTRNLRRFGK